MGSSAHQRRVSRWWVRILAVPCWGQLVVTVPLEGRDRLRTHKELSTFRTAITRWIKRHVPGVVGMTRFHWFGSQGGEGGYHPHLNVLLAAGYLPPSVLADLRSFVARYFGAVEAVVHYSYSRDRGLHRHWVRYICRATFLDADWDPRLAGELGGFTNNTSFGKWDRERLRWLKAMLREQTAAKCSLCGGRVDWRRGCRLPSVELGFLGFVEVSPGLWAQPPPVARGQGG